MGKAWIRSLAALLASGFVLTLLSAGSAESGTFAEEVDDEMLRAATSGLLPERLFRVVHRIRFFETPDPALYCASSVECGRVNAILYAPCAADGNGVIRAIPVLMTFGSIYYSGLNLSRLHRKPKADRSVRDSPSIARHVYEWHMRAGIERAASAIESLISASYDTEEACGRDAGVIAFLVRNLFAAGIRDSQAGEEQLARNNSY